MRLKLKLPDVVQAVGCLVLAIGLGALLGLAAGVVAAGALTIAFGVALERGR